jgi:uncharacterized membrane protein YesL
MSSNMCKPLLSYMAFREAKSKSWQKTIRPWERTRIHFPTTGRTAYTTHFVRHTCMEFFLLISPSILCSDYHFLPDVMHHHHYTSIFCYKVVFLYFCSRLVYSIYTLVATHMHAELTEKAFAAHRPHAILCFCCIRFLLAVY